MFRDWFAHPIPVRCGRHNIKSNMFQPTLPWSTPRRPRRRPRHHPCRLASIVESSWFLLLVSTVIVVVVVAAAAAAMRLPALFRFVSERCGLEICCQQLPPAHENDDVIFCSHTLSSTAHIQHGEQSVSSIAEF